MYTEKILKKYATLLSDYCLDVKKDDRVLIKSTPLATPLLAEVHRCMSERGAYAHVQLQYDGEQRVFYESAHTDLLDHPSPFLNAMTQTANKILTITAPYDTRALSHISNKKKTRVATSFAALRKETMKRASDGDLTWCLCVFPTESMASECGMSLKEYMQFVENACFLNHDDPIKEWQALGEFQASIVDRLSSASQFRFYHPNGTDISFSTKGRTWINSDGKRNMPSGEVFTSPVEDSVNGHIYFSIPTMYHGQDVHKITLKVENGNIIEWTAEIGQDVLDQAFQIPGSRCFGEVAIGTNPNIQTPTKNILFDEKIGGTIHMAIGASYPECGGKNESALHWDMITEMVKGGEIFADGELIYRDGQFFG